MGKPSKHPGVKSRTVVKKESMAADLLNDGKPWTDDEKDMALELWFADAGEKEIAVALGRSLHGVSTIVWKCVMGYRIHAGYRPGRHRGVRTHKAWGKREMETLLKATKKGRTAAQVAAVFNRTEKAVQDKIDKLQHKNRPRLDLYVPYVHNGMSQKSTKRRSPTSKKL